MLSRLTRRGFFGMLAGAYAWFSGRAAPAAAPPRGSSLDNLVCFWDLPEEDDNVQCTTEYYVSSEEGDSLFARWGRELSDEELITLEDAGPGLTYYELPK